MSSASNPHNNSSMVPVRGIAASRSRRTVCHKFIKCRLNCCCQNDGTSTNTQTGIIEQHKKRKFGDIESVPVNHVSRRHKEQKVSRLCSPGKSNDQKRGECVTFGTKRQQNPAKWNGGPESKVKENGCNAISSSVLNTAQPTLESEVCNSRTTREKQSPYLVGHVSEKNVTVDMQRLRQYRCKLGGELKLRIFAKYCATKPYADNIATEKASSRTLRDRRSRKVAAQVVNRPTTSTFDGGKSDNIELRSSTCVPVLEKCTIGNNLNAEHPRVTCSSPVVLSMGNTQHGLLTPPKITKTKQMLKQRKACRANKLHMGHRAAKADNSAASEKNLCKTVSVCLFPEPRSKFSAVKTDGGDAKVFCSSISLEVFKKPPVAKTSEVDSLAAVNDVRPEYIRSINGNVSSESIVSTALHNKLNSSSYNDNAEVTADESCDENDECDIIDCDDSTYIAAETTRHPLSVSDTLESASASQYVTYGVQLLNMDLISAAPQGNDVIGADYSGSFSDNGAEGLVGCPSAPIVIEEDQCEGSSLELDSSDDVALAIARGSESRTILIDEKAVHKDVSRRNDGCTDRENTASISQKLSVLADSGITCDAADTSSVVCVVSEADSSFDNDCGDSIRSSTEETENAVGSCCNSAMLSGDKRFDDTTATSSNTREGNSLPSDSNSSARSDNDYCHSVASAFGPCCQVQKMDTCELNVVVQDSFSDVLVEEKEDVHRSISVAKCSSIATPQNVNGATDLKPLHCVAADGDNLAAVNSLSGSEPSCAYICAEPQQMAAALVLPAVSASDLCAVESYLVDIAARKVESIVVDSLAEETEPEPDPLLSVSEELLIMSDLMQMQQSDEEQLGSLISELTEVETLITNSHVEDLRPQLFKGLTSGAFFPPTVANETATTKPVCKTLLPAVTDFSVVSASIVNVNGAAKRDRCSDLLLLESSDRETVLPNAALAEQTNRNLVSEDCSIGGSNSVHASFETAIAVINGPEKVVEVKSLVAESEHSSDFESHMSRELFSLSSSNGTLLAVGSHCSSACDKLSYDASARHELLPTVDESSGTVGSTVETSIEFSTANELKAICQLAELDVTGVSAQDVPIETQNCVVLAEKQPEKLLSDQTAVDSFLHDALSPREVLPIFLPSNAVGEQLPILDTNVEELLFNELSAPDDDATMLSQSLAAEIVGAIVESVVTNGQYGPLIDDTRLFATMATGERKPSCSCIEGSGDNVESSSAAYFVGDNAMKCETVPTTVCNVSSTEMADSSEIFNVDEASSALKCENSSNLIAETDASRLCEGGLNETEMSRSLHLSALGHSLSDLSDVNVALAAGPEVVQSFKEVTSTITGEMSTPCQHVDELSAIGLDLVKISKAEMSVTDILVTPQKLMVDCNVQGNNVLCNVKNKETSVICGNNSNNSNSCQVGRLNEVSSQKLESLAKDHTVACLQGAEIASSATVLMSLNETSLNNKTSCVTKDDNFAKVFDSVQFTENFVRELQLLRAADSSCMQTKTCRSNALFFSSLCCRSRKDEITNTKTDAQQLDEAFDMKPNSSTAELSAPANADDSGTMNILDNGNIDSRTQSTADTTVELVSGTPPDGVVVNTDSDDADEDLSQDGCLFEEELHRRLDSSATDLSTCSASVSESTLTDLLTESRAVAATAAFQSRAPTAIESEKTCQIPLPSASDSEKSHQLLADDAAVRPRRRRCRTSSEHARIVETPVVEIRSGRSVRQRSSTLAKLQSVYEVANVGKKSGKFVDRSKLIADSSGDDEMPKISPLNAPPSKRRKSDVVSNDADNSISGFVDAMSVTLPSEDVCQEKCSTQALPDSNVNRLSVSVVDSIAAADEPGAGTTGSIEQQRKMSQLETTLGAVDASTGRSRRHSDVHASAAGQTSNKSDEQPTRRKSESRDLKHVSAKLTDIGGRIKRSLSLEHTNIDNCVAAMSEVNCLTLTQAVIAKHPDFLVTIKKCRKYKGSDRVRSKADEIYVRCKQLCMETDCFNSNADILETPLSKGSAPDHRLSVRNGRGERISSDSHQSTMLDSSQPKPLLFNHHRQQQHPASNDSIDGVHSLNSPASTHSDYVEMKGFSVNGPPRRISHYASLRQRQISVDSPSFTSHDESSRSTSGKRRSSASTSIDTVRLALTGSDGSNAAEKSIQNSRFPSKKDSSWSCDDDDAADERNRLRPYVGNNKRSQTSMSEDRTSSVESGRSLLSCTAPVELGTWSSASSSSAFLPLQSVGAVGELLSSQTSAIDENGEDCDGSSGYSLDDDDDDDNESSDAAAGREVLEYKWELEARIAQIIAEEDAEIITSEVVPQPAAARVIPLEKLESYSPRSPGEDSDVIDDEELHILLGV